MPQPKNSSEKGFAHGLILLAILALVGIAVFPKILITKDSFLDNRNVLGDDSSTDQTEAAKKVAEQAQETAKQTTEQKAEQQKQQAEQRKESQRKLLEQQKEASKTKDRIGSVSAKVNIQSKETETETPEGLKIKIKVEDDSTVKVEVEGGKLKFKYSVEKGKVKIEAENEKGQLAGLKNDELNKIQEDINDELEKEGIKIATKSSQPAIVKNNIAATTKFPISVDAGTRQLIITTPAGQKIVTVLPDQAVQNLLTVGALSKIASRSADVSLTNEVGNLNNVVKLEVLDNQIVYRVEGDKNYNLLGFIPVSAPLTAFVSAESGGLVAQDQPLITNLIKLLSR